jgi:hypothetical protein
METGLAFLPDLGRSRWGASKSTPSSSTPLFDGAATARELGLDLLGEREFFTALRARERLAMGVMGEDGNVEGLFTNTTARMRAGAYLRSHMAHAIRNLGHRTDWVKTHREDATPSRPIEFPTALPTAFVRFAGVSSESESESSKGGSVSQVYEQVSETRG